MKDHHPRAADAASPDAEERANAIWARMCELTGGAPAWPGTERIEDAIRAAEAARDARWREALWGLPVRCVNALTEDGHVHECEQCASLRALLGKPE